MKNVLFICNQHDGKYSITCKSLNNHQIAFIYTQNCTGFVDSLVGVAYSIFQLS